MLYLVTTPIGNLGDITLRALETLKSVDYILCEDTRKSANLLNHFQIKKPLKSYHKFSEKKFEKQILEDLQAGKEIALISDAGTPAISDPGEFLIKRCIEEKLPYTTIPGSCAPICALQLSGLDTTRFQFLGFLPKKPAEKKRALIEAFFYPGTTIFFESPQRIKKTIEEIAALSPDQTISLVREITKMYEEVLKGKAEEFHNIPEKGEMVLLIEGGSKPKGDPKEQVEYLQKTYDLSKQDAIKMTAKLWDIPKKGIYF